MESDPTPHVPSAEVERLKAALDGADGDAWCDLIARLAWRPALAIRSRRGAFAALRAMWD